MRLRIKSSKRLMRFSSVGTRNIPEVEIRIRIKTHMTMMMIQYHRKKQRRVHQKVPRPVLKSKKVEPTVIEANPRIPPKELQDKAFDLVSPPPLQQKKDESGI